MWVREVEFCEKVAREGLLKKLFEWRLEGRGVKEGIVDVWSKSMSEETEKEASLVQGEPGAQELTG